MRNEEYSGELKLGDKVIKCAVLDDSMHVVSDSGVSTALGRLGHGDGRTDSQADGTLKLPGYLAANNLLPFIPKDLMASLTSPIEYQPVEK